MHGVAREAPARDARCCLKVKVLFESGSSSPLVKVLHTQWLRVLYAAFMMLCLQHTRVDTCKVCSHELVATVKAGQP